MEDGDKHRLLRFDVAQRPTSYTNRPDGDSRVLISVVVPAMNEAASLPQLVVEIAGALRPLTTSSRPAGFEIVLVDDGSTDATTEILQTLACAYPELRHLRLVRNVGQSAATLAGIRHSRGAYIATLDADLQNDPADLVVLWEALQTAEASGQPVCAALGWRVKRQDVWSKRVISRLANRVRNRLLGQEIRDTGCSVRIFPREAALRLPAFKGCHRFFGPLLLREGCSLVQVPVRHRPRSHGTSHYNVWNRSFRVLVDLFGVAWLSRREVRYEIASLVETQLKTAVEFPANPRYISQEA